MPFLSVSDVSKQFGGVTAVDHVSFAVDRGQVVGFLGPNGAGKSTTMRMITQFYEPDSGRITLDGVPLAEASHRLPAGEQSPVRGHAGGRLSRLHRRPAGARGTHPPPVAGRSGHGHGDRERVLPADR